MNETELKYVITLLLESLEYMHELTPNADTEARIGLARYALRPTGEARRGFVESAGNTTGFRAS